MTLTGIVNYQSRGERFRDSITYIRAMAEDYPSVETAQGVLRGGADMLPKPTSGRLPLLITGGSLQDPDWVAQNSDGWITYPREPVSQGRAVADYRARIAESGGQNKPVIQSLYVDIQATATDRSRPIHLGFQSGTTFLRGYLRELQRIGVNHVALNLRFNGADIETTMRRIARDILPEFPT